MLRKIITKAVRFSLALACKQYLLWLGQYRIEWRHLVDFPRATEFTAHMPETEREDCRRQGAEKGCVMCALKEHGIGSSAEMRLACKIPLKQCGRQQCAASLPSEVQ